MTDGDRPPMADFMAEIGAATLGSAPSWESRKDVYDDWREWGGHVRRERLLGERNTLVTEHGLPANEVDAVLEDLWPDASEGDPEPEPDEDEEARPEVAERAEALLRGEPDPILKDHDNLLDAAYETMKRRGLVGEETNAKMVLLAGVGGCLGNPIHLSLHGESSSGKNETERRARELLPPELTQPLTGLSRHALEYRGGRLVGLVTIQEAEGQEDARYELREAMSEGRLTRWTVDDGENGMEARELEVEIDASIVTTTTKPSLYYENATRAFALETDSSPEQTEKVKRAMARRMAGSVEDGAGEEEVRVWRETVRRLDPHSVRIPYAEEIAEGLPDHLPRTRRDTKRVGALIKSSALLHQRQREAGENGALVASVDDYALVYPLLDDVLEPTVSGLTETARGIIELHEELAEDTSDGWVKRAELEDEAGQRGVASSPTVRKWAKKLSREGIWEGEQRERNAWWHRQVADPDSGAVNLPEPDELRERVKEGVSGGKSRGVSVNPRHDEENEEGVKGVSGAPGDGRRGVPFRPTYDAYTLYTKQDHPGEDGDDDPVDVDLGAFTPSSTPGEEEERSGEPGEQEEFF